MPRSRRPKVGSLPSPERSPGADGFREADEGAQRFDRGVDKAGKPPVSTQADMAGKAPPVSSGAVGRGSRLIGAFSEEHASRLTGVSLRQLGYWDRTGLFRASYVREEPGAAFRRIYSFRDLVALRVLNELRNRHRVPMDHLRQVSAELARFPGDRWTARTLWVLGARVVWKNPDLGRKEEVVSKQAVCLFRCASPPRACAPPWPN